ncbi:MAG: HD domain-containing protein [Rhodospirillales bacterium]|jgi:phosphonate degradation associated HDIG domain protein|nr:HD domain-containing protein [Rhodospirillales bacterium]
MTAPQPSPIDIIRRLFRARGGDAYGEEVTQRAHALQCAALAERDGAGDALITAAFLHDIGHMLHRDAAGALAAGIDDGHERIGAEVLGEWFGPAVAAPVALHVRAKRYLCACEAGYLDRLSAASRRSLALQGGPLPAADAAAFAANPAGADAIRLRRWDDAGKQRDLAVPTLDHFLAIAERCLRRPAMPTP